MVSSTSSSTLFDGVKHKFKYRMRLVSAHFPINANIINGYKFLEIRNYLDEKYMHTINMVPDIIMEKTTVLVCPQVRYRGTHGYFEEGSQALASKL